MPVFVDGTEGAAIISFPLLVLVGSLVVA